MANIQRTRNDLATTDRRETSDQIKLDNRKRNDELTIQRRNKADKEMEDNRLKNDELTASRRKRNDRNPWRTFTIWLLILVALAIGAYYYFFV